MGGDDPWVGKVVSIELGELYATQCKDLNISRFSYFFFFFFFFDGSKVSTGKAKANIVDL